MDINMIVWSTNWINAFKDRLGCPQASQGTQLWWDFIDERVQTPDYNQIGGWVMPDLVLQSFTNLCGKDIAVSKVI